MGLRYKRMWYECANQTDAYVFDSRSTPAGTKVTYTPTFTYHGYRFIQMTAVQIDSNGDRSPLDGPLAAAFPFGMTATAHRAHSGMERVGDLGLAQPDGGCTTSSHT